MTFENKKHHNGHFHLVGTQSEFVIIYGLLEIARTQEKQLNTTQLEILHQAQDLIKKYNNEEA